MQYDVDFNKFGEPVAKITFKKEDLDYLFNNVKANSELYKALLEIDAAFVEMSDQETKE